MANSAKGVPVALLWAALILCGALSVTAIGSLGFSAPNGLVITLYSGLLGLGAQVFFGLRRQWTLVGGASVVAGIGASFGRFVLGWEQPAFDNIALWSSLLLTAIVFCVLLQSLGLLLYFLKKLALAIPLLFGVVTLVFILVELSPGTIADKYFSPDFTPEVRAMVEAKYGLDRPAIVRYGIMIANLVVFEFGQSLSQERPVFEIIAEALPNTLLLSALTLVIIFPTGILLGTVQGVKSGRPTDTGISISSLFFYSMPSFWLALMLQLVFGAYLGWLPFSGPYDLNAFDQTPFQHAVDRGIHLILPGFAMGLASAAGTARYMRSSLLEVIQQDYIRTARAKGLPEGVVIRKHAMRNALLPIITLMGLSLPFLFSGSVLVEQVFAWPGMGRTILSAITEQDTPLLIACFFVFTLVVVAGNLLADLAYALVDPRIKFD